MGRSVPKSKRAGYVLDNDFIVVDDITGVKKMRSECAIDGYGFLSANGNPRHPQETPPIIDEQITAWPDPRPISPIDYLPSPDIQYFLFNYVVDTVGNGFTVFDASITIGLNGVISSVNWFIDGVSAGSGLVAELTMTGGSHEITAKFTDQYGNTQSFGFTYMQPAEPYQRVYTNPNDGDVISNDDVNDTSFLILIDDGNERFSGITLFLNQSANYPEGTELLFEVQTNAPISYFEIQDVFEHPLPDSGMSIPADANYHWVYQVISGVITFISFTPS